MTVDRINKASRRIEDGGFLLGLVLMGLYGGAELIIYVLVSIGRVPYVHVSAPKIIVLLALLCVLPKYMGRATAGQVWITLAQGATRLFGKKPEAPSA
jgi:cellulose synthase/poly-beta-1,6-N-acetylglucosamine synthase-like glycosyltransferase